MSVKVTVAIELQNQSSFCQKLLFGDEGSDRRPFKPSKNLPSENLRSIEHKFRVSNVYFSVSLLFCGSQTEQQ